MNIAITGTTGFIGTHVKDFLQTKGHNLTEINRNANADTKYTLQSDFKGIIHADVWLHLAGNSKDTDNKKTLAAYIDANVTLTQKIFEAFLDDSNASTFIFMSSVKAGASQPGKPLREEDELEIDTCYSISKRMAEKYLLSVKLPLNKRLIILRASMVYGNNMNGNLYALFKYVKRGLPYPLAAYNNARNMLSINNLLYVVDCIINNKNFQPGIYNVADDDRFSTNQLIHLIAFTLKKEPFLLKLPKRVISLLASAGNVFHLPLNSLKLKKLTSDYIVDNTKLVSQLKQPLPYKADNELMQLFDFFKSRSL